MHSYATAIESLPLRGQQVTIRDEMPHTFKREQHGTGKPHARQGLHVIHARFPRDRIARGANDLSVRVQLHEFRHELTAWGIGDGDVPGQSVVEELEHFRAGGFVFLEPSAQNRHPGFYLCGWAARHLRSTVVHWSMKEDF